MVQLDKARKISALLFLFDFIPNQIDYPELLALLNFMIFRLSVRESKNTAYVLPKSKVVLH